MYTITDRPPPTQPQTQGRTDTARPRRPTREQTQARTETAPLGEALEREVSPDTPLPEQETAPGNQAAATPETPATPAAGDLSILEGCWYTELFRCGNQNVIHGWAEYCFDRQGQGVRTNLDEKGRVPGRYQSKLRAYFDRQGRLIIDTERSNVIDDYYFCEVQVVITAILDNSLSATSTTLDEKCCDFNHPFQVTLKRQKPK
jgi:hypothetical protein